MLHCADLQRIIPSERWELDAYYSPFAEPRKIYARFAATIEGIQQFDTVPFKISRTEALAMDPQSRILLEEACSQPFPFVQ